MLTEARVKTVMIRLCNGDITAYDGDAIVNAANNHLWMGSGVAGAIKRKGGDEIEKEAVSIGPVKIGEAVVTGAGKLKVDYVIHAVVMGQDFKTSERIIREATQNVLIRCDELKIERVALPALGTGVGAVSYDVCARAMLEEMIYYIEEEEETSLKEIVIYLYGDEAYQAFAEVFEQILLQRAWQDPQEV